MIPGTTSSQGKYVDPPTSVTASAGNAQATVSFTLPVYDGKGVATYVATSSPSGITASGASSPITVTGLANGTSYTFTVTTISGYGVSATSVASNAVSPAAPPPPDPCAGCPAAGQLIGTGCEPGTNNLIGSYTDGCCGSYTSVIEYNSSQCNPCASVNCGSYGSPPGGVWTGGTYNEQPFYPHCINAGYEDLGYGGYSIWFAYTSSDGCCQFNLFYGCIVYTS